MEIVEATLALLAACIGFALLAQRLRMAPAVMLVLGGMFIAFVPAIPSVALDPELAMSLFLPPLLMASAYRTDWRAFRRNLRPIMLLAFGCVAFTAACIAITAHLLLPQLPWPACVALGAIVAPPDAVAAAAVLKRVRLPRNVATILEGESLINDASSLVLYRFALLAMATAGVGSTSVPFHPGQAALSFILVSVGGVVIGWLVGQLALLAMDRLRDSLLETTTTFLTSFAAYQAAEMFHTSGVLGVVMAGFALSQKQHTSQPETRLAARAIWDFVEFILNSLVFILIGLQLNGILERLQGWNRWQLAGIAAAVTAVMILSRFAWVLSASWLPRVFPWLARRSPVPPFRLMVVVSWCGMRGVVSLAAALALPYGFPERDLMIFLAFTAILATLVVQGTTLEWLVRRLHAEEPRTPSNIDPEEAEGRRVMAQASLAEIERWLADPLEGGMAADIVAEYRSRAGHMRRTAESGAAVAAERASRRRLRLLALEASRAALIRHAQAGHLPAESLGKLEQELDFEEVRLRQVLGDDRSPADRARRSSVDPIIIRPVLRRLLKGLRRMRALFRRMSGHDRRHAAALAEAAAAAPNAAAHTPATTEADDNEEEVPPPPPAYEEAQGEAAENDAAKAEKATG